MYENCRDCPNHYIVEDPDPTDSFCSDDVAVLCRLAANDENKRQWYSDRIFANKPITVSCRPHHIRKECVRPEWCPLVKQEVEPECVCEGNWRNIITEVDEKIGKYFVDDRGKIWLFMGVLWAEDDYYYVFRRMSDGKTIYSTCVMSFELTLKHNGNMEEV